MTATTSVLSTFTINDLEQLYHAIVLINNSPPKRGSLTALEKQYFLYLKEDTSCSRSNLYEMLISFKGSYSDVEKLELILQDIQDLSKKLRHIYQTFQVDGEKFDKEQFIESLVDFRNNEQQRSPEPSYIPSTIRTGRTLEESEYTKAISSQIYIQGDPTVLLKRDLEEDIKRNLKESRVAFDANNFREARIGYARVLQLEKETKNTNGVVHAISMLSHIALREGKQYSATDTNLAKAAECFDEAKRLAQEIKDERAASIASRFFSYVQGREYRKQKHWKEAYKYLNNALEQAEEAKDDIFAMHANLSIRVLFNSALSEGEQYLQQGNWENARNCFYTVLQLAKEKKDEEISSPMMMIQSAKKNLFTLAERESKEYSTQKNWGKAHNCFNNLLQLVEEEKDTNIIFSAKKELFNLELKEGREHSERKDWEQARTCFNTVLQQAHEEKHIVVEREAISHLAKLALDESTEYLEQKKLEPTNHGFSDALQRAEALEDKQPISPAGNKLYSLTVAEDDENHENVRKNKIDPDNVDISSACVTTATNKSSQNTILTSLSVPIPQPNNSKQQAIVKYEKNLNDINVKISALQRTIKPKNPSFILPHIASGIGVIATVAGAALLLTNPIGWIILAGGAMIATIGLTVSMVRLKEYVKRQDQLEALERLQRYKQQIIDSRAENVSSEPTLTAQHIGPSRINNESSLITAGPSPQISQRRVRRGP